MDGQDSATAVTQRQSSGSVAAFSILKGFARGLSDVISGIIGTTQCHRLVYRGQLGHCCQTTGLLTYSRYCCRHIIIRKPHLLHNQPLLCLQSHLRRQRYPPPSNLLNRRLRLVQTLRSSGTCYFCGNVPRDTKALFPAAFERSEQSLSRNVA